MSSTIKKLLGYGLFLLIVGSFFLYAFFPTDTVHQYIEASVGKVSSELSLNVADIRPALPFGITLEDARLHHDSEPGIPVFSGSTVTLSPSFRTLTQGKPIVNFLCNSYGGTLDGVVTFRSFALDRPLQSQVQISGVQLEQYEILRERLKRRCTGVINGMITYAFDERDLLDGSGRADLSLINGSLRFSRPILGVERLAFDRVDARMKLTARQVVFDKISFQGEALNAHGNGTMQVKEPLGRSRLDVRVQVEPTPALWDSGQSGLGMGQLLKQQAGAGQFSVRIYGPLSQPRFSLP
jgi:type II secretion system protein N